MQTDKDQPEICRDNNVQCDQTAEAAFHPHSSEKTLWNAHE